MGMRRYDFTEYDGTGVCLKCHAPAAVVNGVAMHEQGWRDDDCFPSVAQIAFGESHEVAMAEIQRTWADVDAMEDGVL
jgi:hypothetical protein